MKELDKYTKKEFIMKEFDNFIKISFKYDGIVYTHEIMLRDIDIDISVDTWFYYFKEYEYSFEVWGSLDENNNPITGGNDKYGHCAQFAINVYSIEDGEGIQIAQIDDIDIVDCM